MSAKTPAPKRLFAKTSCAKTVAPKRSRQNGGAKTAAPKHPASKAMYLGDCSDSEQTVRHSGTFWQ